MNFMVPSKPQPIPFTREAFKKLQKKFDQLTSGRQDILTRLQSAREMGDLSENGAYQYAKFELRNTDRELRRLTHLLRYGVVIESKKDGTVDFGCQVTLQSSNGQRTFTLVSGHESDPVTQKLSFNSPIGQAVMGKKVGDKVVVTAPAGKITYTIVAVN